jgi:hypothetical protein
MQGNNMTDLPLDEIFLGLEMLSKKPLGKLDPNSSEYTAVVAADYIWRYLTAEPEAPSGTHFTCATGTKVLQK